MLNLMLLSYYQLYYPTNPEYQILIFAPMTIFDSQLGLTFPSGMPQIKIQIILLHRVK